MESGEGRAALTWGDRLGDDHYAALDLPSNEQLGRRLVVLVSNGDAARLSERQLARSLDSTHELCCYKGIEHSHSQRELSHSDTAKGKT